MSRHSEKCSTEESKLLEEARSQFGLTNNSLGGAMVASDTTLVIVGFLTSVFSQSITSVAPDNRKIHVTILSICLCLCLFKGIELFVAQTSTILWRLSPDATMTLFRFLKFICSGVLFITSHFVTDLLFYTLGTGLSWVESAAIIISAILTIYLFLQLFHISSSA